MSKVPAGKEKQYQEVKERWKAANTFHFSVRLQNRTDADLIERIEAAPSKQGELKRLARLGIEYERLQKEKPMPLRPVEKRKPMIDLRKVVRGTAGNPGSVPDPE